MRLKLSILLSILTFPWFGPFLGFCKKKPMYCYFLLFKIVLIITTFLCQAFGFMARLSSSQHIFWFSLDLFCDHIHYKNPWWGSRGPKLAILKFANCRSSVLIQLRNWLLFGTYQGPWTNISSSAKCYLPIPCLHHLDLRENIKIWHI